MFRRYKLMDHVSAMRKYLLLGQGDLIRYLLELLDEGVEIRALKPNDALHSRMHAKTWLLDNAYYCVGTGNATHNAADNNFEECVFTRCSCVVEAGRAYFEERWLHPRTIAVTQDLLSRVEDA